MDMKDTEMRKFVSTLAVLMLLIECYVSKLEGREIGKNKHNDISKKFKFLQWINWMASIDDETTEIDAFRQNLALLTERPDFQGLARNYSLLPFTSGTSPIYNCVKACYGNSTS